MSLYRCTKCGCKENSALGFFHVARMEGKPALCSECATGKWHGRFRKVSAAGMLVDDRGGLWSEEQRNAGMVPTAYTIVGRVPEDPPPAPPPALTLFECGPNTKCEHDYSGYVSIEGGFCGVRGGTAVCSKCGQHAIDEAMWQ